MWAPLITALLGLWLLASPDVLRYGDPARTNDHVAGALMATFGTIAMSESTRPVRWVNLALGLWLIIAPILLNYPMSRGIASVLFGMAAILLATVRGRITERFGGGWKALWRNAES